MMEREWSTLLTQYGQETILHREERTVPSRAFLQPIRETGREQQVPSPLGLRREDRFLYLGAPEYPMEPGDWVEWNGGAFEVQAAHPVYLGRTALYTWAVLRPRDSEQGETV